MCAHVPSHVLGPKMLRKIMRIMRIPGMSLTPPVTATRRHEADRIASQLPTRGSDIRDLVGQDALAHWRETFAGPAHLFLWGGIHRPLFLKGTDLLEGEVVVDVAARGEDIMPIPALLISHRGGATRDVAPRLSSLGPPAALASGEPGQLMLPLPAQAAWCRLS